MQPNAGLDIEEGQAKRQRGLLMKSTIAGKISSRKMSPKSTMLWARQKKYDWARFRKAKVVYYLISDGRRFGTTKNRAI